MKLPSGRNPLSEDEMAQAMDIIVGGAAKDEDIAAFLTALAARSETAEEITGAARYLRSQCVPIKAPEMAIDCCGTGGDGKNTYNISTAAALIAASCGVPIAKHGNRAASSKSGTADVLEALGVDLDLSPPALETALQKFNFVFLMAPRHHPAMTRVRELRKKLGKRTIFNILGPLLNPAGTKLQLIGVYDRTLLLKMAQALQNLGSRKAWIVHGSDGMDEITLRGPTYRALLEDGKITQDEIIPEDFGLNLTLEDLTGGTARDNAQALLRLLEGEKGAYRDIALANAAAVLCLHGSAENLKEGVLKSAAALDDKLALKTLNNYISFSRAGQS